MWRDRNNLVLGFNFFPDNLFHAARMEGIRRFARLGGWTVEFFTPQDVPAATIKQLLVRRRPAGCLVECSRPNDAPPYDMPTPGVFGDTPVVYVDPQTTQERRRIRHAAALISDNAAIARMAFRELSADHPPAYAAVPYVRPCRWSVERVATFRELCAENGKRCLVFPYRIGEELGDRLTVLAVPFHADVQTFQTQPEQERVLRRLDRPEIAHQLGGRLGDERPAETETLGVGHAVIAFIRGSVAANKRRTW